MQLYTVIEVAEKLCVSKQQVARLLDTGRLPYVDISATPGPRRTLRIRADDFLAFLESRRRQPEPHAPRGRRRHR